jgi:hypothetical protein
MRSRGYLFLIAVLLLGGCSKVQQGSVSGKVVYKGQALPGGIVMFWPKGGDGPPVKATIKEDGSYAAQIPVGEAAITVETESLAGKPAAAAPRMSREGKQIPGGPPPEIAAEIQERMKQSGKGEGTGPSPNYVRIDPKFGSPQKSGLKLTVESGEQQYDIEMK